MVKGIRQNKTVGTNYEIGIETFGIELELINLRWNWNWPNGIEWSWNWQNGIDLLSGWDTIRWFKRGNWLVQAVSALFPLKFDLYHLLAAKTSFWTPHQSFLFVTFSLRVWNNNFFLEKINSIKYYLRCFVFNITLQDTQFPLSSLRHSGSS